MSNTVALGAALALVDYDLEILNTVLVEHFSNGKIADSNVVAARAGYEYAQVEYKGDIRQLKPVVLRDPRYRCAASRARPAAGPRPGLPGPRRSDA